MEAESELVVGVAVRRSSASPKNGLAGCARAPPPPGAAAACGRRVRSPSAPSRGNDDDAIVERSEALLSFAFQESEGRARPMQMVSVFSFCVQVFFSS